MSPRQLRSQIARGQQFTSRSNGYVPGLHGAPLSAATVREYRAAERARNDASARFFDSVRNLPVPGLGQTVEERLSNLARNKSAFGDYFSFNLPNRDGIYPERNLRNVVGQSELQDLLKQRNRQNDPNYLAREARFTRKLLSTILEKIGMDDMVPGLKQLSDEDLIAMTQYMGFQKAAETAYGLQKSLSTDSPRWQSAVYEDSLDTLREQYQYMLDHSSDRQDTAPDDRPARAANGRDRYGRFVSRDYTNPDPKFQRDQFGRFAKRNA